LGVCAAFLGQPAFAIEVAQVDQLARRVHTDFVSLRKAQKLDVATAVERQRAFLVTQADVREVRKLHGSNLFVTFKDGNELLMFLGEDTLGSAAQATGQNQAPQAQRAKVRPQVVQPAQVSQAAVGALLPCTPNSKKALIFDCLEDDANVLTPHIAQQVRSNLEAMGFTVTSQLNNSAGLANAALIDDGEYGLVLMRGHGGDLGGDFGFLVRPWYTSYPPANSGFTGTIRASAYSGAAGGTRYGYVITQAFSTAYWTNKAFPSTMFFLESCHGADPGALPGMPTWTTNHGASVWLGWNESVSFNCGDNGTKLFFQRTLDGKDVGEAVAAVYATGCRPPELVSFPSGKDRCRLSVWKDDPNEGTVSDAQDFKLLKLTPTAANLHATITFYAAPSFDEFFFYVSTDADDAAEVLVRCHMNDFSVSKESAPGLYGNQVYTGAPGKSGNNYSIVIPWNTAFGAVTQLKVWLFKMGGDRLPNSGQVVVKK
jgi:hypothetical protein